jgi:hypothetical protein
MTSIDNLLAGLFDYAGLYPPASLDLASAVENYTAYQQSADAGALGRFVVDLERVRAVEKAAGAGFACIRLSVTATADSDWSLLACLGERGARIEMVEIKGAAPAEIGAIARRIPPELLVYFEVPFAAGREAMLDAICAAGARVKLRMGGITAESFPPSRAVAEILHLIADRHLGFKATAGLHHPLRSVHSLTGTQGGAAAVMHGFVNLGCAAALIQLGGDIEDATRILEESDPWLWSTRGGAMTWRDFRWSPEQLRETRQEFFASIGSCSFTEPIADLGALGWR